MIVGGLGVERERARMELGRLRMGRERDMKGKKGKRESKERKGEGEGGERLNRGVAMAVIVEREEGDKEGDNPAT